jgi:hypothetical protein
MDKEKYIESLNRLLEANRITQEKYDELVSKLN